MEIHIDEIAAAASIQGDDRALLACAAAYLRAHPGTTLRLAPRIYHLTDALSRQILQEVFAGQHGWWPDPSLLFSRKQPYSIGFSLQGLKDVCIDGTGATLLADGYMEVLRLAQCENIRIQGLTIDYARRPFSEGRIAALDADGRMTVVFPPSFPITPTMPFFRYSIYDAAQSRLFLDFALTALERVDGQTAIFQTDGRIPPRLCGAPLTICHTLGFRPAVLALECKKAALDGLTIHCQPGIGLLGTRCEDVDISHLRVVPAPGTHFSTNADATHFDACRGTLRIAHSVFEGHGDDAVNVHTYYHRIERLNERSCRMRVCTRTGTHSQTTDSPRPGDTLQLIHADTCVCEGTYRVCSCRVDEADFSCIVTLDGDLPRETDALLLVDIDAAPDFAFVHNRVRSHIARSVLIKSRTARVEDCTFEAIHDTPIEIAAELDWMEGIPCQRAVIRRNQFIGCYYGPERAVRPGVISMLVDAPHPQGTLQGELICEDNRFDCPAAGCAIYAAHARCVRLSGNCIPEGMLIRTES